MNAAMPVSEPVIPPLPARRELGRLVGGEPGPTLVVLGSMHGNEPGGTIAAKRVLDRLSRGDAPVRGELLALAGNLGALRARRRYHAKDLNRQWSEERVAELRSQPGDADDAEDREQRELLVAIESAVARARGPVHVVDLHTTSAPGIPFVITGDTPAQRKLAAALPLPTVLGLEDQLDGALTSYWTRRGCSTFAVEGGQHDAPGSVDCLEAVVYVTAGAIGLVPDGLGAEVQRSLRLLDERRAGLPRVMEVVRRHAITDTDRFVMEPGFRNLDRAHAGQLLARDARGEIRAPHDGLVILPLYQGAGNDGFFWGREMSALRMRTSALLRRLGADQALAWLPGVQRDATRASRLVIDGRLGQMLPLGVLHLLGYRRVRRDERGLVADRQPS